MRRARIVRGVRHALPVIALMAMVASATGLVKAQTQSQEPASPTRPQTGAPASIPEDTQQNASEPCVQPPSLVGWKDYQGPFAKVVGGFARKVERKSVHPPHYKPGAVLCTFVLKDKFRLFAEDMIDPFTILSIGFDAGINQAENDDPSFGQGAAGYGKRFAAGAADQASSGFFKFVVYPTIFSEDPRYYRLAHGSGSTRLIHALRHSVVAHREDGTQMFNFSEWLGTTSAVLLSNVYHPGNKRGLGPAAGNIGISVGTDVSFDILREFWPEIARKLRLPFRDENEPKI